MLAIAAVAAFNVNMSFNSQGEELSAASLANVEALAQVAENGVGGSGNGVGGSVTCYSGTGGSSATILARKCSECHIYTLFNSSAKKGSC